MAILGGILRSQHNKQSLDELPPQLASAIGEQATSFGVGEHWGNVLTFWPSRFVAGNHDSASGQVTVTTADGTVRVYPNRPWID